MTTTATPTARKRCRKTRTKRVNPHPPIVASGLPATEIDLTPGREHMVCPDCRTWCPITGMNGTPKLVPHHTDRAGTPNARRCTAGSDRRVTIDVAVGSWCTTLVEASPTVDSRRATKVLRKPRILPAPAVSQITPAPLSAALALDAYRAHLKVCRKSEVTDHCGGTRRCADAVRLAALYEQLQASDPVHERVRTREARADTLQARIRATTASRTAATEWTKQHKATTAPRTALAKRSGTAVEEANNTRRLPAPGTISYLRGIEVPLKTLHPKPSAR